jgi:hypothetical protein
VFSLGSLLTQLFSREKKARADAARSQLVERLTTHGWRAFAEVARRTGLACEAGPSLRGKLRGVELVVSIAENRGEGLMTRFSATSSAAQAVALNVRPKARGLEGVLRRARGAPEPVGDAEFDAAFELASADPVGARAVLDERARATLLSLPDRMPLYFDHRGGELTLDVSGVELDPDRLVFLLEWLVAVARGAPEGEAPYRT